VIGGDKDALYTRTVASFKADLEDVYKRGYRPITIAQMLDKNFEDAYPGIECGGIYPRWINGKDVEGHSPVVNASRPAGEWQSFDIVFRAPRFDASGKKTENAKFVKVVHNGKIIHENVELNGPTTSAHWEDEKPTGPILLQGDHGPVAYRNLRVKTVELNVRP
jgi:hypothetical protein